MDISRIQELCQAKPQAQKCLPFGDWPVCYKVCGRIFAQVYPDKLTVKCTRFAGELFRRQYPGVVVRGYHCPPVQQPYWNTILLEHFPWKELPVMIDLGYEAVVNKLPEQVRRTLYIKN